MIIDDSHLNAAEFTPTHLANPRPWVGHLPFAYWLIGQVKPRSLVELGTHSGNSYFTFCQSVAEHNLPTKCFAVDTWNGEEHAGFYGKGIFETVARHNKNRYCAFSTLKRMLFEEALNEFAPGSIDLLHIDGLHTYDAVKNDFETWLPKIAKSGLILFHDTAVDREGFGVKQLWNELTTEYPWHLNFPHSHGLGVLSVEKARPSPFPWLDPENKELNHFLRYFSALGEHTGHYFDSQMAIRRNKRLRKAIDDLTPTKSQSDLG